MREITADTNLSQLIKTLRQARGMTQLELSNRTGVQRPTITYIENGHNRPQTETLFKLLEGLGMRVFIEEKG